MRKSYLYALLFIAVSTLLTSCGATYNIQGSTDVSVLDGQKFILRTFSGDEMISIDSCDVVHGQFKFAGHNDTIRLAFITNENNALPVILEEGDITVAINKAGEEVKGTPLNDTFSDFRSQLNRINGEYADLSRKEEQGIKNGENEDSLNIALTKEARILIARQDSLTTNFICDNFGTPLAAAAFQYLTIPVFFQGAAPQLSPWIDEILSKADDAFKNDPFVKFYVAKAKIVEGLMNGTVEMPQQAGQPANYQQVPQTSASQLQELEGTIPTPNQLAAPADSTAK